MLLSCNFFKEWFRRLKIGNFDVRDKERPGNEKNYEDEQFDTFQNQDTLLQKATFF